MDEQAAKDRMHATGTPHPTDGQLVARVLAGDRSGFDILIERHSRQAMAKSYRLLGNMHDAAEVTQDAYLKAYKSLATLQQPEAFAGWLMRIVVNLSLNYRRSRKARKGQLPLDDLLGPIEGGTRQQAGSQWMSSEGDPLRNLAGAELGERLAAALAQLPEKQRQALVLFTLEELPQKEVADKLGLSVEAVKWHVFQGRRRLKELLKDVMG